MPVAELNDLDLAGVGTQTLRVALPRALLGSGVEEHGVLLAVLGAGDHERQAMRRAADVVHAEFLDGAGAVGEGGPDDGDAAHAAGLLGARVGGGADGVELVVHDDEDLEGVELDEARGGHGGVVVDHGWFGVWPAMEGE